MDNVEHSQKAWDVFISHSSEDKESVAIPLAASLRRAGLRVWLDSHVLTLGDSLREKIEEGLSASRFGVVILSPSFFHRRWTARELNGLTSLEDDGSKVILPVWHKISKLEIAQHSPILADRLAIDTSRGITAVASTIIEVVLYRPNKSPTTSSPSLTKRLVDCIETGPVLDDISAFISLHARILACALGCGYSELRLTRNNEYEYVFVGVSLLTANVFKVSGLAFSSVAGPVFEKGLPVTELRRVIGLVSALNPEELAVPNRRKGWEDNDDSWDNPPGFQEMAFFRRGNWETEFGGTVILAGRRDCYNAADQISLQELNRTLRNKKIEIRSYDWLIDACLRLEEGIRKGWL